MFFWVADRHATPGSEAGHRELSHQVDCHLVTVEFDGAAAGAMPASVAWSASAS